jgi:UDP-N-acetylmuramyl tripeptide synthase
MNFLLILVGKLLSLASRILNMGSGSTWPGHMALSVNPSFIKQILDQNRIKVILIAGTNGKTTTGKLVQTILEKNGKKVFQNTAGANLLNGIASSLIFNSNLNGKINKDFAIFEIDENTLPLILKEITNPDYIVILNLFRDQLDRYGEVNTISRKWADALDKLEQNTTLILNADDPQVAFLEKSKDKTIFFGVDLNKNKSEKFQHASDSIYCPNCNTKLTYKSICFSHLGDWFCKKCKYQHPSKTFISSPIYPLPGTYNEYDTNAAVLLASELGLKNKEIILALKDFVPAFGRQETLEISGKKVQLFLSKNPTGFNETLKTIVKLNAENLLLVLNDRIPDGRDVSWIWDVDFEDFRSTFKNITISGDRTYDMGLRVKYAEFEQFETQDNLEKAIHSALQKTPKKEALFILSTYSAMLETRKILTGKKIL